MVSDVIFRPMDDIGDRFDERFLIDIVGYFKPDSDEFGHVALLFVTVLTVQDEVFQPFLFQIRERLILGLVARFDVLVYNSSERVLTTHFPVGLNLTV
jgi:hypothetical protein